MQYLKRTSKNIKKMYDIRLKENFKLFLSEPSRCCKIFFVADLLHNLHTVTKDPPCFVIYVYKTWQCKLDEMEYLVNVFYRRW